MAAESENWMAQTDGLLDAARSKPECAELVDLLGKLRPAIEAAEKNAHYSINELEDLAQRCDDLARMDFKLLYDPARKLFAIGYNVSQHKLDTSYYDLLASEARLGVLSPSLWDRWSRTIGSALGRLLTSAGGKPTLISWSGSMFEYLMPHARHAHL